MKIRVRKRLYVRLTDTPKKALNSQVPDKGALALKAIQSYKGKLASLLNLVITKTANK